MVRTRALASVALIAFVATTANAQPAPEPPDADKPVAVPEPTGEPKLPEVDDPMLKPLPTPSHELHSWREALKLVRGNNTNLQRAAAQIALASGQARQALARALPTLTGTAQVQRHLLTGDGVIFSSSGIRQGTIPDPLTTWNAGLALRVPVFAPKAWYDHGTAKQSGEAARLSASDAQRVVLGAVAESIVSVITAERVAEISRVSLKSTLSTLDLNKKRARLGSASAVDVLRAEQEVSLTRAQVVSADESVRRAREALGLALGFSDPWGVDPSVRINTLASDARAVCKPVGSPDTRADVRAARSRLDLAERNVKAESWDYAPTLDFVSNLNWTSNERFSANGKPVTWTIGGVLSWQLYDGGLRYGNKATAEAQRRLAQTDLSDAKRQVRIEVVQATRAVDVAKANLGVSEKSREIARQSARLSRIAFAAGQGSSFDLVDSARRLREAEIDTAIKEFELVRARIAALLALAACDV